MLQRVYVQARRKMLPRRTTWSDFLQCSEMAFICWTPYICLSESDGASPSTPPSGTWGVDWVAIVLESGAWKVKGRRAVRCSRK
jgi:hypothetical protein